VGSSAHEPTDIQAVVGGGDPLSRLTQGRSAGALAERVVEGEVIAQRARKEERRDVFLRSCGKGIERKALRNEASSAVALGTVRICCVGVEIPCKHFFASA